MLPLNPLSINPAVMWTAIPNRPRLLFPSTNAEMLFGICIRSKVEPSINSFGFNV